MKTLDEMSAKEYQVGIDRFIEEADQWDGALSLETFLQSWDELEKRRTVLELKAQIVNDRLVLKAAPEAPITVRDNRIQLDDGRELVIVLER
ncbi:MAG: hypothetical protein GXP42_00065 [Chloroflexi bacterium]|nr:hypothetical protein [Chloroflexota bacterium]